MDKNKKWETIGLVAIMGCIGVGFLFMSLVVFRSSGQRDAARNFSTTDQPDPETQSDSVAGVDEAAPVRTRELRNSYRRPLALHEVEGFDLSASRASDRTDTYGVMVPDMPGASANPAFSSMMENMPMPTPSTRASDRKKDDKKGDGQDDDNKTGWGWLADDIAVGRISRGTSKNNAKKLDAENLDEDNDDERVDSDPRTAAKQVKQDEATLFMDASYRAVHRDTITERSTDSMRERSTRDPSDEKSGRDDASQDQRGDVATDERRAANPDATASGLVMRDPFARNQEALARDVENASWSFGRSVDSAWRPGDASRSDDMERSERSTTAGRIADSRFAENKMMTERDWNERSAPGSIATPSYASDAAFNSGGGYSAMGFNAGQADAIFSGDAAFNGGSSYTPIVPVTSSGAGDLSPIGSRVGSSLSGADAGGGLRGLDSERAGPRTLPW